MISSWLLFGASFGAMFGVYMGRNIAGPVAAEFSKSGDQGIVQNDAEIAADQKKAIEKASIERMQKVNWWLWWPLLNTLAWLITALFLGFMEVVKFNEGLVILTYIPSLVWRKTEWFPPGNFLIEALTILSALFIVHFVSRWVCSKRKKA